MKHFVNQLYLPDGPRVHVQNVRILQIAFGNGNDHQIVRAAISRTLVRRIDLQPSAMRPRFSIPNRARADAPVFVHKRVPDQNHLMWRPLHSTLIAAKEWCLPADFPQPLLPLHCSATGRVGQKPASSKCRRIIVAIASSFTHITLHCCSRLDLCRSRDM
jgi:hypothetical protein